MERRVEQPRHPIGTIGGERVQLRLELHALDPDVGEPRVELAVRVQERLIVLLEVDVTGLRLECLQ